MDRRTFSRLRHPRSTLVALALAAALGLGCEYDGDAFGGDGPLLGGSGGEDAIASAESLAAFSSTVLPILQDHCAECHSGAGPGSPSIAHADAQTAYTAVVNNQKVNLTSPDSSRLVRRLVADFHYCWSDCDSDGQEMLDAIVAWSDIVSMIGTTEVDEAIESEGMRLADGTIDEGLERYRMTEIARWDFKEGSGEIAHDTSGVTPAMDLELGGGVSWMSNYGLSFDEGSARATRETSAKLWEFIASDETGTQQYSVEAWVIPGNVTQEGPARIVTYSNGNSSRNFTLGQVLYTYDFRNRSVAPDVGGNGTPALTTYDGDQDLQATLQHVVVTFDQYRGRRIYVNGEFTGDDDEVEASRLWNWSPYHTFMLGNELGDERPWQGKIQYVAIYATALTDDQIRLNYAAGVGKRVVVRFDVSAWAGPGTFIEFVVSEFDDYSYLFCEPTFIAPSPTGFRVANLRIAVNGQVAVAGQAFTSVDRALTDPRQRLSNQCAVIAKDLGADADVFTIDFEYLGGFANPIVEVPPVAPPISGVALDVPAEGIRDFARIRDTMAAVTGVDPDTPSIFNTFQDLEQQLPSDHDPRAFQSSHQVGLAKLALEYCDGLVESSALREDFFGTAFEFDAPVATAFSDPAKRDVVIDALVDRMIGISIANQPSPAEVRPVLDGLIDDLTATCATEPCGPDRTRTIVKAACAAVLSSAAVSVH